MQFEQGPVGPATYCQSGQHGVAFTGLKGVAISDAWPRADVEALDRLARWLPWPAVGRCGACRLAHGALEVVRSTRLGSRPARASPGPIMPPAALKTRFDFPYVEDGEAVVPYSQGVTTSAQVDTRPGDRAVRAACSGLRTKGVPLVRLPS